MTVIDDASAPKRVTGGANASRRRQAEYDGYLKTVKKGQVGKLVPTGTESTRALATRIARAGSRALKSVESWAVDGVVYFRVS